jgi:Uri superfamily endonuclease
MGWKLPAELPLKLCAFLPVPMDYALRGAAQSIPEGGGAYLLILRLDRPHALNIPTLSAEFLPPGWYAYAGSARGPGGLSARIARHLETDKPVRWHIDRLTPAADPLLALAYPEADECALLSALLDHGAFTVPLAGFGSSDCRQCRSHLLRWREDQEPSAPPSRAAGERFMPRTDRRRHGRDGQ